ncbi:amino acid synthesis family protein [Rhodoligotrophos defluvii]|uniref:amino acid synthesis family protein n=1 Tax=Rhodoligotrophos defluvii TaxID=2561934 RepID=UPI0010C9B0F7|nr:amino acid synthesis family protein [Rhodoligotrophos defluvii]
MKPEIRKIVCQTEETFIEGGKAGARPITMAVAAAVLRNPWAGRGFVEDLRPEILALAPVLGEDLVSRLLKRLPADQIEAYGKAAVVGTNGEIEHGSALIHTLRFGNLFRNAVGGTTYLSFTNTRAAAGVLVSLPMTHKTVTGTRSHFITATFSIADAPAPDEVLIAIGASDGGRMHPRIGDRFQDMKEMEAAG